MKIIFKEKEKPMFTEFGMTAKFDLNAIKKDKTVIVEASNLTKTRVHTTLKKGMALYGINREVEGFKTFGKGNIDFMSGRKYISNNFIVSKKQSRDSYFKYLEAILTDIFRDLEIDVLTVEFIDDFKNWK